MRSLGISTTAQGLNAWCITAFYNAIVEKINRRRSSNLDHHTKYPLPTRYNLPSKRFSSNPELFGDFSSGT